MDWGVGAGFLGASVLLTLMPGPDILFVIAQSASGGRRAGAAVAFGLCTGLLAHISAAALGISAVVYGSETAFLAVKYLGAAYLFYLAWRAWLSSRMRPDSGNGREEAGNGSADRVSFEKLYRRGILMNVLNPKVSLFFVAFLPQFVVPDGDPVPVQMLVLGGLFLLQALVIFQFAAYAAGQVSRFFRQTDRARRITAVAETAVYLLLGAQLIFMNLQ